MSDLHVLNVECTTCGHEETVATEHAPFACPECGSTDIRSHWPGSGGDDA